MYHENLNLKFPSLCISYELNLYLVTTCLMWLYSQCSLWRSHKTVLTVVVWPVEIFDCFLFHGILFDECRCRASAWRWEHLMYQFYYVMYSIFLLFVVIYKLWCYTCQIKKYEVIEQEFVQYIFMYIPYYTSCWWAEYLIKKKTVWKESKH